MNYQTRLNRHLADYKESVLGIREPGLFLYRGRQIPKSHILPIRRRWDNLLPPARELVKRAWSPRGRLKLHQYFHHLNSSQAFAFNLFFPYFEGGHAASSALLRALGSNNASLTSWEPEAVPNADEGTNLDMRCELSNGDVILCEVKVSERDFGKAKDDPDHRKKFRDTYLSPLTPHVESALLVEAPFFRAYQVLRNVWHLVSAPQRRLLFLMPRANKGLWVQLDAVLGSINSETLAKISAVAIEDVLESLQQDAKCPASLRRYAGQLAAKYVPAAS